MPSGHFCSFQVPLRCVLIIHAKPPIPAAICVTLIENMENATKIKSVATTILSRAGIICSWENFTSIRKDNQGNNDREIHFVRQENLKHSVSLFEMVDHAFDSFLEVARIPSKNFTGLGVVPEGYHLFSFAHGTCAKIQEILAGT